MPIKNIYCDSTTKYTADSVWLYSKVIYIPSFLKLATLLAEMDGF